MTTYNKTYTVEEVRKMMRGAIETLATMYEPVHRDILDHVFTDHFDKPIVDAVPAMYISASDDTGWVSYENGYVEFARFDEEGDTAERLSHWVHWGEEDYPQTEDGITTVLIRILDALSTPLDES
jgi:hypothetical protein